MSDCNCKNLKNGVSDVFGFNYERKNAVVIRNGGSNPADICKTGHNIKPGETWLIDKKNYENKPLSSDTKITVLARFGAKQQMLKST